MVERLRQRQRTEGHRDQWLGRELQELGRRLQRDGGFQEAIEIHREAVAVFRRVVDPPPSPPPSLLARLRGKRPPDPPHVPAWLDLRDALTGLVAALGVGASELPDQALAAARELVDVDRRLADLQPDLGLPLLATDLGNLGWMLTTLGAIDDALAMLRESADIYRSLGEQRRAHHTSNFLDLLEGLESMLGENGYASEAIDVANEMLAFLGGSSEREEERRATCPGSRERYESSASS